MILSQDITLTNLQELGWRMQEARRALDAANAEYRWARDMYMMSNEEYHNGNDEWRSKDAK